MQELNLWEMIPDPVSEELDRIRPSFCVNFPSPQMITFRRTRSIQMFEFVGKLLHNVVVKMAIPGAGDLERRLT